VSARLTTNCQGAVVVAFRAESASLRSWHAVAPTVPVVPAMKLHAAIRSVRATRRERVCTLAGDSIVAHPRQSLTYAITIACPPQEVWPWLAQMGSGGRAGWYSYDSIDNGGSHSTDRILRRLQHVRLGTTFPPLPGVGGLSVAMFEREASLVLAWRRHDSSQPAISWAFVLEPLRGSQTRLIVRARSTYTSPGQAVPFWMARLFVHFGHFLMQRKQLLGIAARAERVASLERQPLRRDAA